MTLMCWATSFLRRGHQTGLDVKGWSGAKSKKFSRLFGTWKIFAALDGQLLLCDRPGPWPGSSTPAFLAQLFKNSPGSTASPSWVTEKWRWGLWAASAEAVAPTAPMICPAVTRSPGSTVGLA